MDRNEDMMFSGMRHPFLSAYKVGCTKEGRITGLDMKLYSNGGYSSDLSIPVCYIYLSMNISILSIYKSTHLSI